jgi:hypothetical protein
MMNTYVNHVKGNHVQNIVAHEFQVIKNVK